MHAYLACFDISDDKTRYRVGRFLERYGNRVQRSVFEVGFRHPSEMQSLKEALRALPFEAEDDVRFYSLCRNCRCASQSLDDRRVARFPAAVIV